MCANLLLLQLRDKIINDEYHHVTHGAGLTHLQMPVREHLVQSLNPIVGSNVVLQRLLVENCGPSL